MKQFIVFGVLVCFMQYSRTQKLAALLRVKMLKVIVTHNTTVLVLLSGRWLADELLRTARVADLQNRFIRPRPLFIESGVETWP